jgi:hypothetical protein
MTGFYQYLTELPQGRFSLYVVTDVGVCARLCPNLHTKPIHNHLVPTTQNLRYWGFHIMV